MIKIFREGKYFFVEEQENIWRRNKYFLWRRRQTEKSKRKIFGEGYYLIIFFVGAAVSGMQIEINTGYSYFMTVAGRRRGRFFLVDLGPGATGR